MAKSYLTGDLPAAPFGNIIRLKSPAPVDGRAVVDSYVDILGENYKNTFNEGGVLTWYVGMSVVTKNTGKTYVLVEKTRLVDKLVNGNPVVGDDGKNVQIEETYNEFILSGGSDTSELDERYALKSEITSLLDFKGSVDTLANLPSNPEIGDVWNIKTEFLYTKPNGSISKKYPAGTNVVAYLDKDSEGKDKIYWDALGGSFDTSAFDWVTL